MKVDKKIKGLMNFSIKSYFTGSIGFLVAYGEMRSRVYVGDGAGDVGATSDSAGTTAARVA